MEIGQAVLALHLIDAQLDLAESVILVFLEIGERDFEYPALEGVVCVLDTSGAVHEGLADTIVNTVNRAPTEMQTLRWRQRWRGFLLSDLESSWGLDVVPILLCECVGLLLQALLAL